MKSQPCTMPITGLKVLVVGGGWVVVQTDFHVKPTTKLLWVAFELGCCYLAWLWGYDNIYMVHINPRPHLRSKNVLFLIFWFGYYFFSNEFFLPGSSYPINLWVERLPKFDKSVKKKFYVRTDPPNIGVKMLGIPPCLGGQYGPKKNCLPLLSILGSLSTHKLIG